jgi:hypothetical protein
MQEALPIAISTMLLVYSLHQDNVKTGQQTPVLGNDGCIKRRPSRKIICRFIVALMEAITGSCVPEDEKGVPEDIIRCYQYGERNFAKGEKQCLSVKLAL